MEKPKFNLSLITGASSGIGEALCYLLANQGINLIICGRDASKLEKIALELKDKVSVEMIVANLACQSGLKKIIEVIQVKIPDLVINNAGFGLYGDALNYRIEEQLEILKVNGNAVAEITLESAKILLQKKSEGTILNVSSVASFQLFPGFSMYSASKAFVNQFSESLDYETKPHGIRVLTSCPGMVKTGFRSRASGNDKKSDKSDEIGVMDASFAAKEIWNQILNGKALHIFNWRYRLAIFFTRYLLPKSIVAKKLYSNIRKRTGK